ncbi:hypothetical protein [Microbacterium sp. 1P06AB]|uniref:hypothetical protein n=1 Tax=Microbacterium sp. 1P06AB TaxID=3132289 RepID=UPI0039A6D8DD
MDDIGHIIATFTVVAEAPVEGLEQYSRESRDPADPVVHHLGSVTIDEPDAKARADALESAIDVFLDRADHVPRPVLHGPGVFVRLYVSFGHGAQTITSRTIRRLADVNATLWIDA